MGKIYMIMIDTDEVEIKVTTYLMKFGENY